MLTELLLRALAGFVGGFLGGMLVYYCYLHTRRRREEEWTRRFRAEMERLRREG